MPTRGDPQRSTVVAANCFRLLCLRYELQNSAQVMKTVVDEKGVMRLCRSMGMQVHMRRDLEANSADSDLFALELFNPTDYDADFTRFLREKIFSRAAPSQATRRDNDAAEDAKVEEEEQEEEVKAAGLFGPQANVKAQLRRMGCWSKELESSLSSGDQGVYCVELGTAPKGPRCFVAFVWLASNLFEPLHVRDAVALSLRFLLTLSPSIVCCLSLEDLRSVKGEVEKATGAGVKRFDAFSVSFRVQRQEDQTDCIQCEASVTEPLLEAKASKSVKFVKGSFPAIALASAAVSTTKLTCETKKQEIKEFAQWVERKSKKYKIVFEKKKLWRPILMAALSDTFDWWPKLKLKGLQKRMEAQNAHAKKQLSEDVDVYFSALRDRVDASAQYLLSLGNGPDMDKAFETFDVVWSKLAENEEVWSLLEERTHKLLYLPKRLKESMDTLQALHRRVPEAQFLAAVMKTATTKPQAPDAERPRKRQRTYWRAVFQFFQSSQKGPHDAEANTAFLTVMRKPLKELQSLWLNAVHEAMRTAQDIELERLAQESNIRMELQFGALMGEAKVEAFEELCKRLESASGPRFRASVSIRSALTSGPGDSFAGVVFDWKKESARPATDVMTLLKIEPKATPMLGLLGTLDGPLGATVIELATVKASDVLAVIVSEKSTTVRLVQFPLGLGASQAEVTAYRTERDLRTFRKPASLCSIFVEDRRIAFAFGCTETSLGCIAMYRFDESLTKLDSMRSINLEMNLRLTAPLTGILLGSRSIYAVDCNGEVQAFDTRTRQTSKKVSFGKANHQSPTTNCPSDLLAFSDGLVIGRVCTKAKRGRFTAEIESISTEDHRNLPTVSLPIDLRSADVVVGSMGDILYVSDATEAKFSVIPLNVTVRSDSYRIQRSSKGAPRRQDAQWLSKDDEATTPQFQHWLWSFYHVFEKFPVRGLLQATTRMDSSSELQVSMLVDPQDSVISESEAGAVFQEYFCSLMMELRHLNKPLGGFDLTKSLTCSTQADWGSDRMRAMPARLFLLSVITFIPVQICRAEENALKLLQDGQAGLRESQPASESDATRSDAADIAQSIRFGLLSPLLESWGGRCVVVTSMGKQSTGKSYFLNHLTGSSFAISGSRCTDGAWMSVRVLSSDVLLVVLDFEGLGSFERTEQEDIFLSVLNASVSMLTIFRMESRFDKDLDALFSRFQKGVQLIKHDARLFRGLLHMSVKDVNVNDQQEVVDELLTKLGGIFETSRDQNFLTEMYAGQLDINCSPPLGTTEYYQSLENVAKTVSETLGTRGGVKGFVTGKAFLDCLRVVLAKISILDWTSMDKSTQSLLVVDVKRRLPGVLRMGCHVPEHLMAEKSIPTHMRELVVHLGTRERIVVSLRQVCDEHAMLADKLTAINERTPLDSIADESVDFGLDVTSFEMKKVGEIQKVLVALFERYLALCGKTYASSRLMAEDQTDFDTFLSFLLRRRKMKVSCWLRDSLESRLPEVRAQLEQQSVDLLGVYLSRCQHRCAGCQLGCMHSVTHPAEIGHDCSTDHTCHGSCEYPECCGASGLVAVSACSRNAGHEGKCECKSGDHTCGQPCQLSQAPNCDTFCSQRAGHQDEHRCSVQLHACGAPCSAATCNAMCLLDIQREHSVHKCAEVQCLSPCLMRGCKANCGERNHFHGQLRESQLFMEESSWAASAVDGVSEALANELPTAHMCRGTHACDALCEVDGVCEQKVSLKKSSRTYEGARGSFEYVFQEMNGSKKPCALVLPSGKRDHAGFGHSCVVPASGQASLQVYGHSFLPIAASDDAVMHYCAARCPCCDYYCSKNCGHLGLHATAHGNMRRTFFLAKGDDIDLEDRKYKVGEQGIAEMCNLYCAKSGRGHLHYLDCEQGSAEKCVFTGSSSNDQRRHCKDELFPPPDRAKDELLHAQYWATIGWEDPCISAEEREEFAKCPYRCDAPEHGEKDRPPSYCVLNAWHQYALAPDSGDDGFAYVDGHKFDCVHATESGKFHHVLVLDGSGSMCGQPWFDLLGACEEFLINRLNDGGQNDVVSVVTFNHESVIQWEATLLPLTLQLHLPKPSGGTSFAAGLQAANEVLSRNNFTDFQPVVVLFSDGHPQDVSKGLEMAAYIRAIYAKYDLKAFVVGFGRVNLGVLNRVADALGGEYQQVVDAGALKAEFQRIAATLGCNQQASLAFMESSEG